MKIILASNSPRRKQLLEQIEIDFDVIVSDVEEIADLSDGLEKYVEKLAYIKAKNVYNKLDYDRIVIGLDTVVSYNGEVLGKPLNKEDAFRMLKKLQGNKCDVITGLCVINSVSGEKIFTSDRASVYIQNMSDDEIWEYIKTNEPMDKAGAFAIQGLGARYITKIEGDYYSIVGLPINKLYNILKGINREAD